MNRTYQQLKNIYHYCQAQFWRAYYRWPDKNLYIYGVTGTNGKTTTCVVFGAILREEYGVEKVGLLTTIFFWFGKQEVVNKTKMTTLKSRDVFKHLRQMNDTGVEHVVLEATSHALDQNRLAGVRFNGGIILNLSREHLDYHGDMKSYAKAKIRLADHLKERSPLVINKQFSIFNFQFSKNISIFQFSKEQAESVKTDLLGGWNKENVLAASLLAGEVGISSENIDKGIARVSSVPGRMEWVVSNDQLPITNDQSMTISQITNNRLPRVLIDYAVTPDALERVYKEVKDHAKGKIFAVLGACGKRDRGKRPAMAQTVAKYADELILTREDPWTESEEQIYKDLEQGLLKTTIKWQRITDRRKAIRYCLEKAGADDIVVVTGKGAEVGMAVGSKVLPWSEREVIMEELKNRAFNNNKL